MTQLLALHGFLGAPSDWDEVLAACSLSWRAIPVPFHGATEEHASYTSWDETVRALAAQLGPGKVVLCGYSLGARLALGLAFALGERLAGLVSISGHAGLPEGERAERRRFEQSMAARLESAPSMAAFVDSWEDLPLFASQTTNASTQRLQQQRQIRTMHDPKRVSGAFRVLGTSAMPYYEPRLAELSAPVLWLAGGLDEKYRDLAVRYASRGTASSVVLEGVGHNPLLEAQARTAAAIEAALANWGLA